MSKKTALPEQERSLTESAAFRVEAHVRDRDYTFDVSDGGNLLAAALKNKVPVDHICRVGLCGTCQVRVIWGADSLSQPSDAERLLLDEAPLSEGVRLACQVRVFDDVGIEQ